MKTTNLKPIMSFKTGDHTFSFTVKNTDTQGIMHKYVVYIRQEVDMSSLGEDDFKVAYKCVCPHSRSESSAIHYAGKKYIKNWNKNHRIGKDYPLLKN